MLYEVITIQHETILELQVNNHPGVMSHICGLFSRRAYNLEGIVVVPIGRGKISRMWLKVIEENNLEQIVKQLQKLPDVQTRITSYNVCYTKLLRKVAYLGEN